MIEHPLSAAWGGVGDENPHNWARTVWMHDGMVIHGWLRYSTVLKPKGMRPVLRSIGAQDPIGFVLSKREWMPAGKAKTLAVAKCAMWLPPGRPSDARVRAMDAGDLSLMTAETIAKRSGVSVRSVVRRKAELREEADLAKMSLEEECAFLRERVNELELDLQQLADSRLKWGDLNDMVRALNMRSRVYRERLAASGRELNASKSRARELEREVQRWRRRAEARDDG